MKTERINRVKRSFKEVLKNHKKPPFVVSVCSGKGGVGKTLSTVSLACATRRMGYKVLVIDGDLGLANVDVVLGLQARYNINDVLDGQVDLAEIIIDGPLGLRIISSGSGITKLAQLSYVQRLQLLEQIETLEEAFDIIFIDTGAGISETVLHFNCAANEAIVVTTPEPHAMTDAYAMIKVLSESKRMKEINLITNMVDSASEGFKVFKRIADVSKQFLNININHIGSVPFDPRVQQNVVKRQLASENSSFSIAGQAWQQITRNIVEHWLGTTDPRDHDQVWRELLWAQQEQSPAV